MASAESLFENYKGCGCRGKGRMARRTEGHFDLTANRKKSPVEMTLTIHKAIGQKLKMVVRA